MKPTIEARYRRLSPTMGKASVHIQLGEGEEGSGITVTNITVDERGGKVAIKMPFVRIGEGAHKAVSFQGALKQGIAEAIAAAMQGP